jgi:hypothetical protein
MRLFIVCGNMGQPSGYIEVIKADDQADAVRKTVKKHGKGIRKVFVKENCPPKLWAVVNKKYNKGEEFWFTCKTYREALTVLGLNKPKEQKEQIIQA